MESTGSTQITPIPVPINPRMRVPVHCFEDRTPFASVQLDGDIDLSGGVRVEELHRGSLFACVARVFAVSPVSGQLTIPGEPYGSRTPALEGGQTTTLAAC